MKKVIGFILVVCILTTATLFTVYAAEPQVKIIATETATGVDVVIKMSGNITNLAGFEIYIGYDKAKVTAVTPINTNSFADWEIASSGYPAKSPAFNTIFGVTTVAESRLNVTDGADLTIATMSFTKNEGQTVDTNTIFQGEFKPVLPVVYTNITSELGNISMKTTPTLVSHSFIPLNSVTTTTAPPVTTSNPVVTTKPPVSTEIIVTLNDKAIDFDQQPIIENDRTLVPMRAIFEAMGATVNWDEDTQTVTSVKGNITITMQIGNKDITVNGKIITLDVPPKILNDRTLVPVRAVAESFGAKVTWIEELNKVEIIQ